MNNHIVYILKCSDNSYYIGSTHDLDDRLKRHNDGTASSWTHSRRPVKLVYYETYGSLLEARRREAQIKRWTREKKEKLINNIWNKQI